MTKLRTIKLHYSGLIISLNKNYICIPTKKVLTLVIKVQQPFYNELMNNS